MNPELGQLLFTLDTLKDFLPEDGTEEQHRRNLDYIEEALRFALPLIQQERDRQAGLLEPPPFAAN